MKVVNLYDSEVGQLYWHRVFTTMTADVKLRPLIVLSRPSQKDHSILVNVLTDKGPEEFFSWMIVFKDE